MSKFINDTLQSQIERGEVFFSLWNVNIGPAGDLDYLIETDSKATSLRVGIGTLSSTNISLYKDPIGAHATGVEDTLINMNFVTGNATNLYGETQVSPSADGTLITSEAFREGVPRIASPFNTEAGVILESNTDYLIRVNNSGTTTALYQYGLFFREIN